MFRNLRPYDINVEAAISNKEEELIYYQYSEPALNTLSSEVFEMRKSSEKNKIIGEKKIMTKKLDDVLDKYLPLNQSIDFLSVDVEGLDLKVLQSNNWIKYRPEVVLVEDLQVTSITNSTTSPIVRYLSDQNYDLFSKSYYTLVFLRRD